jgi:hypothetical protein
MVAMDKLNDEERGDYTQDSQIPLEIADSISTLSCIEQDNRTIEIDHIE